MRRARFCMVKRTLKGDIADAGSPTRISGDFRIDEREQWAGEYCIKRPLWPLDVALDTIALSLLDVKMLGCFSSG
jgi:hypothetical protein